MPDDDIFDPSPAAPQALTVGAAAASDGPSGESFDARQGRAEREWAEYGFSTGPGRAAQGEDAMSVSEFVCASLVGGYGAKDICKGLKDPLTGRPMTLKRFEEAFADEIESGGAGALLMLNYTKYSIATGRIESKGSAQIRALDSIQEKRDTQRWGPIAKKVEIDVTTRAAQEKAAFDGAAAMDDLMRQMAELKAAGIDKDKVIRRG